VGENNCSSTERADLGDDLCTPFFVLCLLAILFSVLPRYMNSDFLFVIFKLVFNIKSKELVAQVYVTLAKFDTTLTSHLGFPDPNYFICLLFTLSVPSEDYCINVYMMWGFWCSFC